MRAIEAEYEGWKNLHQSDKPYFRAKADFLSQQIKRHKTLLAAMYYLVPTAHMRELIKDLLRQVEESFGKVNALQMSVACGLFMTGRLREFRTRHWGDVIQPPTKLVHYDGR